MTVIKAKNRDIKSKGKQLRRDGIIPGVLYGKHLKESLCVQFSQSEVEQFLKTNSVGAKVEVEIDGEKTMALLMEVSRIPVVNKIEHLNFQALTAGEKVTSTAQIILINKENIEEIIQQLLFEISYKALPSNLIDKVEVDIKDMKIGDSITVADLELSKNENIEVLTSSDTMVVSIAARRKIEEEVVVETPVVE